MKLLGAPLIVFLFAGLLFGAPATLKLTDGSVVKGEVMATTAADVTVVTEFGVVRLPLPKLAEDSKKALGLSQPVTIQQLEARIAALESQVKSLEGENANLRRQLTEGSNQTKPSSPSTSSSSKPAPVASGTAYAISSTGKRHNSHCRYFGAGKACGPTDGVACKICGG